MLPFVFILSFPLRPLISFPYLHFSLFSSYSSHPAAATFVLVVDRLWQVRLPTVVGVDVSIVAVVERWREALAS
ncbi:hypothetical protein B0H34DRAFT_729770 [Crassisporium funariophilum]|nr:hypothetical protein B0H34DRAFT_729770 [Crassisporium funariophilum]